MQHTFVPQSTRVSHERWQEAQAWECAAWTETERQRGRFAKNIIWPLLAACGLRPRFRGSDWNEWWAERFENYAFLPPVIENAVELGCGPYTNLRCILHDHAIKHAVLSDPLIRTYVRFPLTFVRHAFLATTCLIDDHPIEETPFASNYFDLVIMINVLDHVRDAELCLQSAVRLTKPGGWFVCGQDLSDRTDRQWLVDAPGHDGHPITLDETLMRVALGSTFKTHVDRVLTRAEGRAPDAHYGTFIFAGVKCAEPAPESPGMSGRSECRNV